MAVLTNAEKAQIRNILEKKFPNVTWPKAAVNDAAQVVENFLTDNQAAVAADVNTATAPYSVTFTAAQKKALSAAVFYLKYIKDIA